MTVPARTRKLVYQRDNHECVHCGATDGLTLQHRAGRGMGGSKLLDGPENLITMCATANYRLESDAEFSRLGITNGWKLRRHQNPETEPVLYAPAGAFFMLNPRGTRTRLP